jgi:hypothetical protein
MTEPPIEEQIAYIICMLQVLLVDVGISTSTLKIHGEVVSQEVGHIVFY